MKDLLFENREQKEKDYIAPEVEILEVEVEKGFQASGEMPPAEGGF